ncbi:MAG TPA: leucyl aminopeptidase family protein [Alphaproteobacteria bacterium]|nr:leucyl aminopeptidase family protein [Alphaproteobacteria bacterium]HRK97227.1 leucyl aminopeptidase family protein [Alphaproteobacteria bacterium]
MTDATFDFLALPDALIQKSKDLKTVPLHFVKTNQFEKWVSKQNDPLKNQFAHSNWTAKDSTFIQTLSAEGHINAIYIGYEGQIGIYTICAAAEKIPHGQYEIERNNLKDEELENACIGWLLSCYQFSHYKKLTTKISELVLPSKININRIESTARASYLVRNLINLPPNALGPRTLAETVATVAKNFDAMFRIVEDKELLEENLPLIYAVGDGSERRPCLAEMAWGNPKHPKVTLVGKGVCFDTGGYDIKPSAGMLLMKKDMGGAAMALATALMIMSAKLPVYLRLLIPCVENSVSGRAYRPSDILTSRSGTTVEIGNTDAEGRLVLADCLTMACEESPDLLIDFATLTGAAHYAVGYDMGVVYSNDEKLGHDIQKLSMQLNDPLWNLPLWKDYKKDILSPIADINNAGSGNPAGSITAALFLQHFVTPETTWVHIDERAWQNTAQPGKSQGGKEMGIRTITALIEQKFAKAKPKKKAVKK